MDEQKIANEALGMIWVYVKPWIPKGFAVLLGTYGLIFVIKKFWHKMPCEIKSLIPMFIGVLLQLIWPMKFKFEVPIVILINVGIGIALGAIISSLYDVFIRRFKQKIHTKAGLK